MIDGLETSEQFAYRATTIGIFNSADIASVRDTEINVSSVAFYILVRNRMST